MNSRARAGALVVLLGALLFASRSSAKPIVVLAPFRGSGTQQLEVVIQKALKPYALVLSSHRYSIVAKGLVAENTSAEDIAAVTHELSAAWAITGTLKRDGKNYTLTISLRSGATGKTRDRLRYTLKKPRATPAVLKTMKSELVAALLDALTTPAVEAAEPPPEAPKKKSKPAPEPSNEEQPQETPAPVAKVEPPKPAPAPTPAPPPASNKRPRWANYFDLEAGVTLTGRHFAVDPPPPTFSSQIVAGIHIDGTLYPLAGTWSHARGIFAGLGLGATLDKPFWPPSTATANTSVSVATTELRVEGGLRWKITLYKPMPRPQLQLIVQGGLHEFFFAPSSTGANLIGVPDTAYIYASVGGGLTIHFAEWSWIWVKFVYHIVPNAGPIQYTTNYGLAFTNGYRFSGGLDFLAYKGFKLGAQGFYEAFMSRFGYEQNPAKIATGTTDQYYGAMFVVGYVF